MEFKITRKISGRDGVVLSVELLHIQHHAKFQILRNNKEKLQDQVIITPYQSLTCCPYQLQLSQLVLLFQQQLTL